MIKQTLALGALLLATPTALAQTRSQVYGDSMTQQTQTVYADADMGLMTYESQAAGSKQTQSASQMSFGGWAGEDRVIGASITAADADVPFELNGSHMKTSFRDVKVMARLGWLVPSIGVSLSEVDVTKAGTQTVGLYGTGINAGLGLTVPVAHVMVVGGNVMAVESNEMYDKTNTGSKLGQRLEADANAAYHLVERYVDFMVGYRVRQYLVQADGSNYTERAEGAYAGFRLGLYF